MANINNVVLVGRLTRDAEMIYSKSGNAVSKFSLAVNSRKKSGDGWIEEANFFDVVAFGRTAEALSQYLVKGKEVAIVGHLNQDRWATPEGDNRSKISVVADRIEFTGKKGDEYE